MFLRININVTLGKCYTTFGPETIRNHELGSSLSIEFSEPVEMYTSLTTSASREPRGPHDLAKRSTFVL